MLRNDTPILAQDLIDIELRMAPLIAEADEIKDKLRDHAITLGKGFDEPGVGGKVKVSKEARREFRGRKPQFDATKFIDLIPALQDKIIAAGVVTWVDDYSSPRKPSVTVELDD
jgi:hypothetical protein